MAKVIIPQKLILEVDSGELSRAILLYRVNDSGSLSPTKSVRVTLSLESANSTINEAVDSAQTSEGL